MKRTTLNLAAVILFTALIGTFSFAGRPIGRVSETKAHLRPHSGTDSLDDVIQRIALQYKEAILSGDSSLVLKCYAADACILAPNMPTLCGQAGILRFFKGIRMGGVKDAKFTSLQLYGETAEYVTEQGVFEVFDANGDSLNKGKVMILYKKTADGWKMFRHMLNFDAAMPMAAPGGR